MTRGEGAFWGSSEEAWLSSLLRVYGNLVDANIANGIRSLRQRERKCWLVCEPCEPPKWKY